MLSFFLLFLTATATNSPFVHPQALPPSPSPSPNPSPSPSPKSIFLLAGQSNMAGRGGVVNISPTGWVEKWDGVVPPECGPNPSILRLAANLTWVEAREPIHADIDLNKTNGIGPGMAFANAVLGRDRSLGSVGLVPCADGGTKISEWERGTVLYDRLMRRARAGTGGGGGGRTIRALLWYQGESDAMAESDAALYKGRLEKFFSDVRADLQSPELPIFQVAIASGLGPFTETVREAQLGLDLPNVRTVDAKGLPLGRDHVHLTTPAQVRLGQMLADAFLQSVPGPAPLASKASTRGN
ncbi:probable carbohydrate esterase At4g34215 isoform X2 [Syzygium oleosum]|uniref:probable carbohydrate esterase At4g34215 isoform X2 n=1 Tax=Syzygium oleosum TaxID=219896 RepID=UPI0011D24037|nr:probable carbohydrate esterase At4g34215 isoform X2 [Syzygium oleosum]